MRISFFISLLFLFSSFSAQAFRLSPMVVEFSPLGDKATQTFTLENTGTKRTAVELELTTREMAIDGKETRKATQDFLIFPEQLSLEPGEKRNVRVTYVGEQKLDREHSYRFIASQLQVDFKKPQKNPNQSVAVNFLLQYVASIYVTPDAAKYKIKIPSVKSLKDGRMEFVVQNSGTKHQLLNEAKIRFSAKSSDGKRREWQPTPEELKDITSENVLAGVSRRFTLKRPSDFPLEDLKAEISF